MTRAPGALVSAPEYALAFRLQEAAQDPPRRLLVLVHGWGADELQFADLGARVDTGTLVALPRGPRSADAASFGWYRVAFPRGEPAIEMAEAEAACDRLAMLLGQLRRRHGIAPERTVVAGFSQGGTLAAGVALREPAAVGGFAVLCGQILPGLAPVPGPPQALARLQALLVHGRHDATLPEAWATHAGRWLSRRGIPHVLRLRDTGHALSPAVSQDLLQWLADARQPWNA